MVFWAVVALLLSGALLMLVPPLWRPRPEEGAPRAADVNLAVYRDQMGEIGREVEEGLLPPERLQQARDDIHRRVLEETATAPAGAGVVPARRTAGLLVLLLPVASVLAYLALGDLPSVRGAPDAPARAAAPDAASHSVSADQIESMVANLAQRLKTQPDDAEGWMMLGRSYTALGRYPDAVIALRRATALVPSDATLLADLADVLGMAQGKRLAGEPAQLVQQALDIDPRHVKALALAGSVAFESRDYEAASAYWERLVAVVPADSDIARSVRGSIAQARQLADGAPAPARPAPADTAAQAGGIVGEVHIAPALAARIQPGDTLFVFARAVQGARMPLAILRVPVGTWPRSFVLDDRSAMAPEWRLSGAAQVTVSARISRSGDATPRTGDLVGQVGPMPPQARGVKVVIDAVQP